MAKNNLDIHLREGLKKNKEKLIEFSNKGLVGWFIFY